MAQKSKTRKRRKDETLAAALDIGASKVSCFIARINEEDGHGPMAEIVGVGCYGAPGHMRGTAAVEAVETAVRGAVEAAVPRDTEAWWATRDRPSSLGLRQRVTCAAFSS